MVIEWLKYKVPEQLRELFIQKEAEVWTPAIAKYPGFVSKEIWINPEEKTELVVIVRWSDLHGRTSIPREVLEKTDVEFNRQMNGRYELVETKEYQVRKFVRTPNLD